jgi:RNA polymerase sigma-70 factor, ECF subfamily
MAHENHDEGRQQGSRMLTAEVNPFRHLRSVPDRPAGEDPPDAAAVLMGRVASGDQDAFTSLYDDLSGLVYGVVLRVVRDRALAEEVTQEAFLDVWRRAPRFDPTKGSIRSWVSTIAHHRAVDRVRSEESSRAREERDGRLQPTETDGVAAEVEDTLDRERVRLALEHLTAVQRQTIELAYYGGHTYRQVAVMLDMPEGTVKTRIRDGLIRLRDILGTTP